MWLATPSCETPPLAAAATAAAAETGTPTLDRYRPAVLGSTCCGKLIEGRCDCTSMPLRKGRYDMVAK